MMTVKQVSELTGVSIRTLQFYDEIGLLKPTKVSDAGYRLYDDSALESLQQILFFKELDFTLKEIRAIIGNPKFDPVTAFQKQRELIELKRNRLNSLLGLLDRLIQGERCMEFKDFDLSGYFRVLKEFRETHTEEIGERFGSVEAFDEMVSDLESRGGSLAEMAALAYGSTGQYADAMRKNLGSYLENGPSVSPAAVEGLIDRTETLTRALTADLARDPASPEVQKIVRELVSFTNECNSGIDMGENYWPFLADTYLTNPVYIEVNDKKYGAGASKFIGRALKALLGEESF